MVIAITFGVILASLLFMREIAKMTRLHDLADHKRYAHEVPAGALLYKINGPLFFAAAERVFGELVAQVKGHTLLVLQMEAVSILDAGGLSAFLQFEQQMVKAGVQLRVAELQFQPLKTLARAKVRPVPGQLEFYGSLEEALKGEHSQEQPAT
jgi:sulfate permease, SulP family